MNPLAIYQKNIDDGTIQSNPYQLQAVKRLDIIYQQLIIRYKKRWSSIGQVRRKIKPRAPIKGLYLWGSVGIGKTYLVDLFFDAVPVPKLRMHYHEFMQSIHHQLTQQQGSENPLKKIAKKIADEKLVICLDEFLVADIADAMVLGLLLKHLFYYGACLVTTSNTAPDRLYLNGIQRDRFLPAITLIKSYTTVIHQQSTQDYRRSHLDKAGIYFTPLNDTARNNMQHYFKLATQDQSISTEPVSILNRTIPIVKASGTTIWFDFNALCHTPRSQNDYIELCKHYNTFFISDIPCMKSNNYQQIIPFIKCIDVLYDNQKQIVISAETTPSGLYQSGKEINDYQRTISRIIEMGSKDYSLKNKKILTKN